MSVPTATDDTERDADVAARYFFRLVQRGIERSDALALTQSYSSSRVMGRSFRDEPKPPWEKP